MPIPAIIGAAGVVANLVGAHKASKAATEAAKIQGASADKAQAFNERVYGDQKQLMSPYVQAGNDSLARLMAQHWGTSLPAGMSPSGGSSAMLSNAARGFIPQQGPFSGAPQAQPGGGNPNSLAAMTGGGQQGAWTMPDGTQYANGVPGVTRGQAIDPSINQAATARFLQQTGSDPAAASGPLKSPQGGGQMVKLQGPDGSTRDVPAQLADQFIARGAKRVG